MPTSVFGIKRSLQNLWYNRLIDVLVLHVVFLTRFIDGLEERITIPSYNYINVYIGCRDVRCNSNENSVCHAL